MTKTQQFETLKKIRGVWNFNPATKVFKNKKKYNRKEKHPMRLPNES